MLAIQYSYKRVVVDYLPTKQFAFQAKKDMKRVQYRTKRYTNGNGILETMGVSSSFFELREKLVQLATTIRTAKNLSRSNARK